MAQIGNLGSLRVALELPLKGWNKNYKKVTEDVKKYPKTTDKALKRAGKAWEKHAGTIKAASIGMIAFGTATTIAFGMAVNEAATFQQSMVNTQSVIGATSTELQQLTGFAREMGKQTVFSAKESADAMYALGSAGLSTKEIMDSLRGTLDLAAATNSDLAFTSRVVASTLSQYNLAAEESGRISNVFAATISASQATMDKLATSMSLVGPVARSIGMSLEETTGILGSLFNAGLDASTAGTSLRQSIAQLLKPTDAAKEALGRLNIETLDSSGNLRKLTDIIRDLETSGLSAADALAIFGVRAGPGMLALVSKGADAIEDLTAKVTDTNKAAEIAALQVGTFQGQMKLLKSAVSELKITIGDQLLPVLTEYTTKLTGIVNKTSDWAAANPILTKTLVTLGATVGIVVGTVGGLGLLIGPLVKGIGALKGAAFALGNTIPVLTVRLALMGKTIAGIGAGVGAAGAAAGIGVFAAALKLFKGQVDDTRESLIGFDSVTKAQRGNIARIQEGIDEWKQELQVLQTALDSGTTTIQRLNKATGEWVDIPVADRIELIKGKIDGLTSALNLEKGATFGVTEETVKLTGAMKFLFNPLDAIGKLFAGISSESIIVAANLRELTELIDGLAKTDFGFLGPLAEFGFGEVPGGRDISPEVPERFKKLQKELNFTNLAQEAADGIKLVDDAVASTARTAGKLTTEIIEVIDDPSLTAAISKNIDDRNKAIAKKNDAFFKERDAKAKKARDTNLADAKQAMQEWQNSWGAVIGDVEGNFAGLYASIIDPSIEIGWKNFFGRFKDITIQTAADILADATIKRLFKFGADLFGAKGAAVSGGGSLAVKIFGTAASTGAGTISPTASTSIGSIALGAKLGTIASAVAPAIIPIALAAAGFGIFAALAGGGQSAKEKALEAEAEFKKRGVRNAEIQLRRLTDEEKEALREGTRRRRPSARRKPPLDPRDPGGLVAARIASSQRIRIRSIVDDSVTGPPSTPFVPRRPEGTDRFGRPLAATTAMAPARGGVRGDVNIEINVVVQGQDIRDMDIAEWQRIFRDNLQPAAEAEGKRFVSNDNLMTG